MKLNQKAFGWVVCIFGGVATFVIAICGKLALLFEGALNTQLTQVMDIANPFYIFDLSTWLGVFLGTIEALIFWFIVGWVFAWLYNKFL